MESLKEYRLLKVNKTILVYKNKKVYDFVIKSVNDNDHKTTVYINIKPENLKVEVKLGEFKNNNVTQKRVNYANKRLSSTKFSSFNVSE